MCADFLSNAGYTNIAKSHQIGGWLSFNVLQYIAFHITVCTSSKH